MLHRLTGTTVAAVFLLFAIGCSNGVSPTAPGTQSPEAASYSANHYSWGLWEFTGDDQAGNLDAVQLREGNFHLNALQFLEPPALVYLSIESFHFNGNLLEVDIGLRHPFLGMNKFTGFDVCGIFITNGSVSGFTDPALLMAGVGDTRLLNPDGYSRWWNPTEFPVNPGTMYGYKDGLLGATDASQDYNCTLNGYKYFCDDLDDITDTLADVTLENRGLFTAGQKNVRHYTIEKTPGTLAFNYAVDACWKMPVGEPPIDPPDDFPPDANRVEAWRVSVMEVENTLWNDGVSSGGGLTLLVDVYDWFDPDLNSVRVESPGNFAALGSPTPIGVGTGYATYEIEITDATPGITEITSLISVVSEQDDFGGFLSGTNTTAYFTHTSDVSGGTETLTLITPNGGEYWYIGYEEDITWTGGPGITYVRLDYSTDSGMTYPNIISDSTENDGVLEWTIPDDPSSTARVRVQSVSGPFAEDESDEDFTISVAPDNFLYMFSDYGFFSHSNMAGSDNALMYENMLNIPLVGPYASNTTVKFYDGHTDGYDPVPDFETIITGLGYNYIFSNEVPLDLTGLKMVVLSQLYSDPSDGYYSDDEINDIRGFINGGGICIMFVDHPGVTDASIANHLLEQLSVHLYCPDDKYMGMSPYDGYGWYTDITADPITAGVTTVVANVGGHIEVLDGGTSIVRGIEKDGTDVLTAICKSPII